MTERDIKKALGRRVRFTNQKLYIDGTEYILSGAVIRRGDNGFYYQAELTGLKCRGSVLYCRLDEIERCEA